MIFNPTLITPAKNMLAWPTFIGRKKIINTLVRRYSEGTPVFECHYGINRSGKSWTFTAIKEELKDRFVNGKSTVYPIHVDGNTCYEGGFLRYLALSISDRDKTILSKHIDLSEKDISDIQNDVSGSQERQRNKFKDLYEQLEFSGAKLIFIVDEAQALVAPGIIDGTGELEFLSTEGISTILVGRSNAETIYGEIYKNKYREAAPENMKVSFTSYSFSSYDMDDMNDYWRIFPEKLGFQLHPWVRKMITYRAGQNPYLLAVIGAAIENQLFIGNATSITGDFIRKIGLDVFVTTFEKALDILREEKQLAPLALCVMSYEKYKIPDIQFERFLSQGYLCPVNDRVMCVISQEFTDYLVRAFYQECEDYRVVKLAEVLITRMIILHVRDVLGKQKGTTVSFDELQSCCGSIMLKPEQISSGREVEVGKLYLFQKRDIVTTNWYRMRGVQDRTGFNRYFNNENLLNPNNWKSIIDSCRIYRNEESHHDETGQVDEDILRQGLPAALKICEQLAPQFASWEG